MASTTLGNSATTPSPAAAEDVTLMGGDRLLHHSAVHAQSHRGGFFVALRVLTIRLHIGSENRSKPTLHGGTRQLGKDLDIVDKVRFGNQPNQRCILNALLQLGRLDANNGLSAAVGNRLKVRAV